MRIEKSNAYGVTQRRIKELPLPHVWTTWRSFLSEMAITDGLLTLCHACGAAIRRRCLLIANRRLGLKT
jgi:hypothetical protein